MLIVQGFDMRSIAKVVGLPHPECKERCASEGWTVQAARYLAGNKDALEGQAMAVIAREMKRKGRDGSKWDIGDWVRLALEHSRKVEQQSQVALPDADILHALEAEVVVLEEDPGPFDGTEDEVHTATPVLEGGLVQPMQVDADAGASDDPESSSNDARDMPADPGDPPDDPA